MDKDYHKDEDEDEDKDNHTKDKRNQGRGRGRRGRGSIEDVGRDDDWNEIAIMEEDETPTEFPFTQQPVTLSLMSFTSYLLMMHSCKCSLMEQMNMLGAGLMR